LPIPVSSQEIRSPANPGRFTYLEWDDVESRYVELCAASSMGSAQTKLEFDSGYPLEVAGGEHVDYPSFTIEMETGTGKTYVYLKTLYSLYQHCHFQKFIIVVPSRAIYEGVLKSFDDTKAHFDSIFDKPNFTLIAFDKAGSGGAKSFAEANNPTILLLTLDSFNKTNNKIFKGGETPGTSWRPFEFIAATRPILVLDEPQNMTSEKSKQALRCFNPLFALRYSATHREVINPVYKLSPFEAYRDGLVKKIQVYGFSEYEDLSFGELELVKIDSSGKKATLRGYKDDKGLFRFSDAITVRTGDDISDHTNNRYHKGISVTNIDRGDNSLSLSDERVLSLDFSVKRSKQDMFRAQLRETIRAHIQRQDRLLSRGVKVLSLIFIDRVANYQPTEGFIRRLFEEEFNSLKALSPFFSKMKAEAVHRGYFAKKPSKKADEEEYFDTITGSDQKEAEKAAYELIMRKKEILLSFPGANDPMDVFTEKQVSFIFAHSALKEGWDNPNVFQICTLSSSVSEIKKRQEIGRGLRLPVDQSGTRLKGLDESVLTVIANESYESYVKTLQTEYEEDGSLDSPRIGNARKEPVERNQVVFASGAFQEFWIRLVQRVDYDIKVDSRVFVREAAAYINEHVDFPEPRLFSRKGRFGIDQITIDLLAINEGIPSTARFKVTVEDTTENELIERSYSLKAVPAGMPLSHFISDPIFRAFMVVAVDPSQNRVEFADKRKLFVGETTRYQVAAEKKGDASPVDLANLNFAVPNFLEKIGMELGLTKKTVLAVFQGIHPAKKQAVTKNPEGFINEFFKALRTVYADHIADQLEFHLGAVKEGELSPKRKSEDSLDAPLEEFFPQTKDFVGTELAEVDGRFMYKRVQIDSDVEKSFIQEVVMQDPKVMLYFKFPLRFKLFLPSIIGNYNPDWGIIRKDSDGGQTLHLVRETKGQEDVRKLRFDHEKRKIKCARKYFKTIDVDYRPIAVTTRDWWKSES
jgi:type III restriction enzyme